MIGSSQRCQKSRNLKRQQKKHVLLLGLNKLSKIVEGGWIFFFNKFSCKNHQGVKNFNPLLRHWYSKKTRHGPTELLFSSSFFVEHSILILFHWYIRTIFEKWKWMICSQSFNQTGFYLSFFSKQSLDKRPITFYDISWQMHKLWP